jgi:hypothetical protein
MMKKHATFIALGLAALMGGCGDAPREDPAPAAPTGLQAAPVQDMPTVQQLAATRTPEPVTAVPVKYAVDPGAAPQSRVAPGAEAAPHAPSHALTTPGAARRAVQ